MVRKSEAPRYFIQSDLLLLLGNHGLWQRRNIEADRVLLPGGQHPGEEFRNCLLFRRVLDLGGNQ